MKIKLTDRQKVKTINCCKFVKLAEKICLLAGLHDEPVSFVLCNNRQIKAMNKKYFGRDCCTDVIAFPLGEQECFGEVFISVEQAVKECAKYGNDWRDEFTLYVIHGILHIIGYEDTTPAKKRRMFKKQNAIFNKITNYRLQITN